VLKHFAGVLLRLVVETSAAAAEVESKAVLAASAPPNQLVCNLSAVDLLSTISSFGTVGKPGNSRACARVMIFLIVDIIAVAAALLITLAAVFMYLLSAAPVGLQLQYQEEKDCVAVSFQPVQCKVPVSYVVQVATVEDKVAKRAMLAYSTVGILFASPDSHDPQGFMQALLLRPLHVFSV